jgi:hypothetical protein
MVRGPDFGKHWANLKNVFFAAFHCLHVLLVEMTYLSYLCEVQDLSHFTVHINVYSCFREKTKY